MFLGKVHNTVLQPFISRRPHCKRRERENEPLWCKSIRVELYRELRNKNGHSARERNVPNVQISATWKWNRCRVTNLSKRILQSIPPLFSFGPSCHSRLSMTSHIREALNTGAVFIGCTRYRFDLYKVCIDYTYTKSSKHKRLDLGWSHSTALFIPGDFHPATWNLAPSTFFHCFFF